MQKLQRHIFNRSQLSLQTKFSSQDSPHQFLLLMNPFSQRTFTEPFKNHGCLFIPLKRFSNREIKIPIYKNPSQDQVLKHKPKKGNLKNVQETSIDVEATNQYGSVQGQSPTKKQLEQQSSHQQQQNQNQRLSQKQINSFQMKPTALTTSTLPIKVTSQYNRFNSPKRLSQAQYERRPQNQMDQLTQEGMEDDSRDVVVEEVMSSYEFKQAEIYFKNGKYQKARQLVESLLAALRLNQINSPAYVFMLKRLYYCQIKQEQYRDAEIALMNIKEIVNQEHNHEMFPVQVRMASKFDILLHYINFQRLEISTNRVLNFAKELLKDPDFRLLDNATASYGHFLVGLAYFVSEKMPYAEVKIQFKHALGLTNSDFLRYMILHNLAVVNFVEITDHNDRVLNGDNGQEDEQMLEQIEKVENQKKETRAQEKKIRSEIDRQEREKRYKERQQSLKKNLSQHLQKFKKEFKFTENEKKNRVFKSLAGRITRRLEEKEEKRKRAQSQMESDLMFRQKVKHKGLEVIDLLMNSMLPTGQVIQDPLRYRCDPKRIDPSVQLPRRTIECYYQRIVEGVVDFNKNENFNEVLPLLYLSLRYSDQLKAKQEQQRQDQQNKNPVDKEDKFIMINKLDDFMVQDQSKNILDVALGIKVLEFIARCYVQDSRRYPQQALYWLEYFTSYSFSQESETKQGILLKRAQALRAAYLIDQGKLGLAKQLLESLVKEKYSDEENEQTPLKSQLMHGIQSSTFMPKLEEKDTEMIVCSLLGILKKASRDHNEQIEGIKLTDRAQEISSEIGTLYERKKWLIIPEVTGIQAEI